MIRDQECEHFVRKACTIEEPRIWDLQAKVFIRPETHIVQYPGLLCTHSSSRIHGSYAIVRKYHIEKKNSKTRESRINDDLADGNTNGNP